MSEMIKVCSTCKYYPRVAHCNGCRYDGRVNGNTKWEPIEPFIAKPCISEGVCREDKMNVLEKIKEEIACYKDEAIIHAERNEMIDIILEIIEKYIKEGDAE